MGAQRTIGTRINIIGCSGSGKSTLLAMLGPLIEAAGRPLIVFKIGPGERRLPEIEKSSLKRDAQLVVDGYEQLSSWSRLRVRWLVWKSGAGLLVTAHADVGLPTLYSTKSSEEIAAAVVTSLTASEGLSMSASDVADAYRAAGGNVREMLFKLFDVYQQRGAMK